jgi:quercetin dioxygenase-like cupin family protein
MRHALIIGTAFTTVLAAQSGPATPVWETLLRAPLPDDSLPKISVFSLPVSPAPPVPPALGAGHTHAGPVFACVVRGQIENQVEPDPPQVYKSGSVFYEIPGHVRRFLRDLSSTEPAQLIIFQAGETGKAAPVIKTLLEEPLLSTAGQNLTLLRLNLPPAGLTTTATHANPGVAYVLEGKIASDAPKTYGPGELFVLPANRAAITVRNTSDTEPARLLLYQLSDAASIF